MNSIKLQFKYEVKLHQLGEEHIWQIRMNDFTYVVHFIYYK